MATNWWQNEQDPTQGYQQDIGGLQKQESQGFGVDEAVLQQFGFPTNGSCVGASGGGASGVGGAMPRFSLSAATRSFNL